MIRIPVAKMLRSDPNYPIFEFTSLPRLDIRLISNRLLELYLAQ